MDDSFPTKPATVTTVEDLARKLKNPDETETESWAYRVNGFIFQDDGDTSGFGSLLRSSKRHSPSTVSVQVNTRKVVPWPKDVRDGDLVQAVASVHRRGTGEARVDALSVVRTSDLDTEFDLKSLQSSTEDVIRFMETPRPERSSLIEYYIAKATSMTGSAANSRPGHHAPYIATAEKSIPLKVDDSRAPVDVDSLFDDDDDMDTAHLIAGFDKLSPASNSDDRNKARAGSASARGAVSVESLVGADRASGKNVADDSRFLAPPPPPSSRRPASPAFASKNAGRFSRSGNSRRNKDLS